MPHTDFVYSSTTLGSRTAAGLDTSRFRSVLETPGFWLEKMEMHLADPQLRLGHHLTYPSLKG